MLVPTMTMFRTSDGLGGRSYGCFLPCIKLAWDVPMATSTVDAPSHGERPGTGEVLD